MEDGDLLLIDAGCEWGYHSADITRTFPVNGRFTAAQRAVYEIVLRAQLAGIAAARPGNRYEAIHEAARRVLAEGLVALGALPRGDEEKAKAGTVVHPVPKEVRGIGIRIEDDVLITPDGCDVLTAGTPKTVDEVERACAETPRLPRS